MWLCPTLLAAHATFFVVVVVVVVVSGLFGTHGTRSISKYSACSTTATSATSTITTTTTTATTRLTTTTTTTSSTATLFFFFKRTASGRLAVRVGLCPWPLRSWGRAWQGKHGACFDHERPPKTKPKCLVGGPQTSGLPSKAFEGSTCP